MAKKADFWDYIIAFSDPNVAIEDGYLVTANGVLDGGKSGIRLTDEAIDVFNKIQRSFNSDAFVSSAEYKEALANAMRNSVGGSSKSEILEYLNNYYGTGTFWQSLSGSQKSALLDQYGASLNGNTVIDDITSLERIGAAPDMNLPVMSEMIQPSADLYRDIDAEIGGAYDTARSRLDDEADAMRQDYASQLQSSADMYDKQASRLLSNQYLSNAQTYDVLQSDMRKARQNALEAGASAGVRLAGNVNALLSAQNKQSQTALDTSNALAEMLLQQRNAAAGIRSDYRNYMSDLNQRKTNLDTQQRTERENLYGQRHSAQVNDYNTALGSYNAQWDNWTNKFNNIPESNMAKSAYMEYERNKSTR